MLHLITCVDWILLFPVIWFFSLEDRQLEYSPDFPQFEQSQLVPYESPEPVPSCSNPSGEHSYPFYLFYFVVFTSLFIYCYPLCCDAVAAIPYYITCAAFIPWYPIAFV